MATSLPLCCSRRMYSILSSGLASAMKSSTPAFSAMYFAVSGLSPVTMTVLTPILRRRSNRSRMPVLMMSCSSMTPITRSFSDTTSGVPPFSEISVTSFMISSSNRFPAPSTIRRIDSKAPLRIRRPSARSTPEHFVSAEKRIIRAPIVLSSCTRRPCSRPSSMIDFPSGVSSDSDEYMQASTNRPISISGAG